LKTEKSVFNNDISGRKNATSSIMGNKIVTIERKKITSTIISTNYLKRHNIDNNIEAASCYTDKRSNVLNSSRCQIDVASIKRANLYEDKTIKMMPNGVDKTQSSSMNFGVTNHSTKFDNRDSNNNDFVNMISPLSDWSNWTYYTNNKKHNPTRDDIFFENGILRSQRFFECNNQFDFLPRKLYGVQHRHVKLTNVKCFNSPNDTIPCK